MGEVVRGDRGMEMIDRQLCYRCPVHFTAQAFNIPFYSPDFLAKWICEQLLNWPNVNPGMCGLDLAEDVWPIIQAYHKRRSPW